MEIEVKNLLTDKVDCWVNTEKCGRKYNVSDLRNKIINSINGIYVNYIYAFRYRNDKPWVQYYSQAGILVSVNALNTVTNELFTGLTVTESSKHTDIDPFIIVQQINNGATLYNSGIWRLLFSSKFKSTEINNPDGISYILISTSIMGPDNRFLIETRSYSGEIKRFYRDTSEENSTYYEVRDCLGILNGYYLISEDGKLFSLKTYKLLITTLSKTGYPTFTTYLGGRNSKSHCFKVHRLVGDVFVPNPDNKPFINHIDGIKVNNNRLNLEWVTNQENVIHAYKTGLTKVLRGCEKPNASIKDPSVIRRIRSLYGAYRVVDLVKMFNVSKHVILGIVHGEYYSDVV